MRVHFSDWTFDSDARELWRGGDRVDQLSAFRTAPRHVAGRSAIPRSRGSHRFRTIMSKMHDSDAKIDLDAWQSDRLVSRSMNSLAHPVLLQCGSLRQS